MRAGTTMDDVSNCSSNNIVDTAYSSLESRRRLLEAKISVKNCELKNLCIQEAELTGILPPEIPLEPGEALPKIRRRVGTSFTYPERLINQLNIEDDKTMVSLELEYKVQKKIANAVLKLSNDSTNDKTVRQKHRKMYQECQQRIIELETKLNLSSYPKLKKKPRPKISIPDLVSGHSVCETNFAAPEESDVQSFDSEVLLYYSNLKNSQSHYESSVQKNSHYPRIPDSLHASDTLQNSNIQPKLLPRSNHKDNCVCFSTNSSSHFPLSDELPRKCIEQDLCTQQKDRFHKLKKKHIIKSGCSQSYHSDKEMASATDTYYSNVHNQKATVLLPNQIHVEHSSMRTNYIDNVKNEHNQQREKMLMVSDQLALIESENKNDLVKKWLEASFGSHSMEPLRPPTPVRIYTPPLSVPCPESEHSFEPLVNSFATVPFGSPESHMVVEVGTFQPYYETAKPFEMSDIYKYSTRYRMPTVNSTPPLTDTACHSHSSCPIPRSTLQNIDAYQPSRSPSYQPPIPPRYSSLMKGKLCPVDSFKPSNVQCSDQKALANEMLYQYQDDDQPQLKPSTLV